MPRMNILNAVEHEAFYSPPVFNSFQRSILTSPPRRFAAGLRSPAWRKPASCSSRTASWLELSLKNEVWRTAQIGHKKPPETEGHQLSPTGNFAAPSRQPADHS
jgi:hypothetical protein